MRMVKMKPQQLTLDGAIQKFLLVKESQHTGEETMKDYRNCLSRFLQHSRNSLDKAQLENDVLTFFAAILCKPSSCIMDEIRFVLMRRPLSAKTVRILSAPYRCSLSSKICFTFSIS